MSKLNTHLLKLAFDGINLVKHANAEKLAFVTAADLGQQGGQQGGQAQPQTSPGQPQPGGQPSPAPAPQPQPQPQGQPQPQQQQQAPQQAGLNKADLTEAMHTAILKSQDQPKKQSTDERLTALEGSHIRLLELLGHLDPQKYQDFMAQGSANAPAGPAGLPANMPATGTSPEDPLAAASAQPQTAGPMGDVGQAKTANEMSAIERFAQQMRESD